MDDNNISSYVNELAIMHNIPLLKDEIIEELNFYLLIKKSYLFYKKDVITCISFPDSINNKV